MFTLPVGMFKNSGFTTVGLSNWVKADVGITQDTSNAHGFGATLVLQWNDQSGNNTNWVRAADGPSTGQAFFVSNAQNGLPVLHSSFNQPALSQSAFITGTTEGECFVMIKNTTGGTDNSWSIFGSEPSLSNHYPFGTDIYEAFGSTARKGPFAVPSSAAACMTYGVYNITAGAGTNGFVIRLNNISLGTATITNGWAGTFSLFDGFIGDIGELLIYNRVLSSIERTVVYNYLKARWNTP